MGIRDRSKAKKRGGGFKYTPRTTQQMQARASQQGGARDSYIRDEFKLFNAKGGNYSIRILPPTWDDADHYGKDVFVHYNIGPDGGAFLCLDKMNNETCPICEERNSAEKQGEEELAAAMKPTKRVLVWLIDRDKENEGPKLWAMPWTFDRDLSACAIDKKTQEVYQLDDPDEGFDVSFEVTGSGTTKKYIGIQLDRRPSPLSDDEDEQEEWLEYVSEHPAPDCLVFADEERVAKALSGGVKLRNDNDKDKDGGRKSSKQSDDKAGKGRPTKTKSRKSELPDVDDLDWETIHDLEEDDLEALADREEIDLEDVESDDWADFICEELEIEKPRKSSMRDRIKNMRNKDRS